MQTEFRELDEAIGNLLSVLNTTDSDSEPYSKMADQLIKLMKAKEILGNLEMKEFDGRAKMEELRDSYASKKREIDLKEKEVLGNFELKEFDNRTKLEESQNSFALKKREIDLKEKELEKPDRVSKETLAVIGGNIAGILLIIGYERMNVIASKALSFVMKSR